MSKKKKNKKKGNLFLTASWQKLKSESELRNKKIKKIKVFYTFKIWKNNLDESRENGGWGWGVTNLKCMVFFPMG